MKRFLRLNKALPERDEKFKICGWKTEKILLNPYNLLWASYIDEIGRAAVTLTNGQQFPVHETLEEINRQFEKAMSDE